MNPKPDNTSSIIRKFEPMLAGLSFYELAILNKMVVDRMLLVHKAGALVSMSQFHVGDRVSWDGTNGEVRTGIVTRLNQKRFQLKPMTKDIGTYLLNF